MKEKKVTGFLTVANPNCEEEMGTMETQFILECMKSDKFKSLAILHPELQIQFMIPVKEMMDLIKE